jgi:hypothetical protein
MTPEHNRLDEAREHNIPWKKWEPYLSERQWGTVRATTISAQALEFGKIAGVTEVEQPGCGQTHGEGRSRRR